MRRAAAVAASVASEAAASVALAAAWRRPIHGYGRPGGGVRPDHPTLLGRSSGTAVTFMMPPTIAPSASTSEVVVVPFAGWAARRCALEDQRPRAQVYDRAAPLHSITSSASASNLSGTVSPSAFAVFTVFDRHVLALDV